MHLRHRFHSEGSGRDERASGGISSHFAAFVAAGQGTVVSREANRVAPLLNCPVTGVMGRVLAFAARFLQE